MKGKFYLMMKRWWIIAVVVTLAMSLTSCSRKANQQAQADFGFTACDGNLGSVDLYVIPSKSQTGLYEVTFIPVSVNNGDVVKVHIANQNLDYKQLLPEVVLSNDQEVFAGYVTEAELEKYDIFAITPFEAGTDFLNGTSEYDIICTLPIPETTVVDEGLSQ